jgi:tetratricopeptide (TPR) repeat protein
MAILMIALAYYTTRVYAAEVAFANSLRAAQQNDGNQTYQLQQLAIRRNPRVSAYHRTYALTNLNLANAIAAQGELSDQDRANIAQLIQQSIREAKNAVSLDQRNAANWETLATIYRNLINVAQNSEQWTIASYLQAIQTDPINPRLRLELGGVYFGLTQYDQAIRLFQQATELKPDWANAYFNLAMAHKEKNELQLALVNMQQVVQLLDPESPDMARAQEELNELREALNIATEPTGGQPTGDLTQPAPLPSPLPDGEIELPEDSGPEDAGDQEVEVGEEEAVEPTNIPEATPSPSPSPSQ